MTFKRDAIRKNDFSMEIREKNSLLAADLKLKIQPWLKFLIAFVCLALGLRLWHDSGPVALVIGFGLMIRFPSYCLLGWHDFRVLRETQVAAFD